MQAGNKQRQAEQREDDLAQHLHGEIDGNACTARTERHAALPQQPRADEFAADLRDRKKIVDRLSDPAKGDEGEQPGRRRGRQKHLPRQRREEHLDRVEGDHREHAPARGTQAAGDLGKAVIPAQRERERQAKGCAEGQRKSHQATPAAATRGVAATVPASARNALKRRATLSGVTVGRPSLPIEPGAMRT